MLYDPEASTASAPIDLGLQPYSLAFTAAK
jgi:hypothetical protein